MRLLDELATPDGEDRIAYRGSERFVARLTAADERQRSAWTPRASGTYLITGGFGGLGLLLAAWLVRRGARQLALVGHHAPSPRARAVIAECEQLGARVTTFEADVAHRDQLDNVFKRIAIDGPPVRGVFHLAGALADAMLPRQDEERFRTAFAPKIEGAWHLHDLTQAMPLDCFVLFSSAVAILGAAGQANYAAANASLDGLARCRRARGLPALSINWGPWAEAGMAARDRERWRTRGVEPLTTAEALGHLEAALGQDRVQVVVLSVRWAEFFDRTAGQRPPLLSELAAPQSDDLVSRLIDSAPAERFELLQRHVRQATRMVLGLPSGAELDDQQGFSQLGMDSLMALELRNTLQASIGHSLPSTVAFDFPTVAQLCDHLSAVLNIETSATPDALAELIGAVHALSADELAALNGDG
jgi:NAD(P)-dependent dehydrogenase (short-subunit alcohol dehydrogenase family)/acyl carrier protein